MQIDPAWLAATWFIDHDHPDVAAFVRHAVGDTDATADPTERAVRLFHAVRDGIRYDPYHTSLDPADYERTVETLLAGGSDPVITKRPEGAWTHDVTDAALN